MMTIKLMNRQLSEVEFKRQAAYLMQRLGKKAKIIITDSDTELTKTNLIEDLLVFESTKTIKLYSRAEGYNLMNLEIYISQKEAEYGIH